MESEMDSRTAEELGGRTVGTGTASGGWVVLGVCGWVVLAVRQPRQRCRNTLVLGLEGSAGQATYGVYQPRLGALWDCSGCDNRNVGESYMENPLICTVGPLIMAHLAPFMWLKGGGMRLEGWVGETAYGNQNQ